MGLLWPNFTGTFGSVFGVGIRDRGLLLLPRGDLHRDLRVRMAADVTAGAPAERDPDRDHRRHRLADGDRGQRVDEPSGRLHAAERQGHRRAPVVGAVRQLVPVERADPHVHRGLHRQRFHGRGLLRVRAAPRAVGTVRADRADDPADDRCRSRRRCRSSSATGPPATSQPPSRSSSRRSRGSTAPRAAPPSTSSDGTPTTSSRAGSRSRTCFSLLTDHSWNGTVQGLRAFRASRDRPPVNVVHWSFQTWSVVGTSPRAARRHLHRGANPPQATSGSVWFYRALVLAAPLSVVALIAGWVVTEVGRQPWVVYGVMRTDAAVTGAHGIAVGYGAARGELPGRGVRSCLGASAARAFAARARSRSGSTRRRGPGARGGVARCSKRYHSSSYSPGSRCTPCSAAPTSAPASGSSPPLAARMAEVRDFAHRAMAPVWEANHVWLIFVLAVFWTAYPKAFGSITSTLAVPLFIALLGILFRGAAYALREGATTPREAGRIDTISLSPRSSCRSRSAPPSAASPPIAFPWATPPDMSGRAGSTAVDRDRRARRRDLRPSRRRVPGRGRGHDREPTGAELPPAGALLRSDRGGDRDRRVFVLNHDDHSCSIAPQRPRAPGVIVSALAGLATLSSSIGVGTSRRAIAAGSPSRRSSRAGRYRDGRRSFPT